MEHWIQRRWGTHHVQLESVEATIVLTSEIITTNESDNINMQTTVGFLAFLAWRRSRVSFDIHCIAPHQQERSYECWRTVLIMIKSWIMYCDRHYLWKI